MNVINTLAPIFAIVALGVILRRTGFLSGDVLAGLAKVTYWVALPCLLFVKIGGASVSGSGAGRIFLITLAGTLVCIVVALALAFVIRMPGAKIGTFVQASFRGNLAFVGLPVVFYAFEVVGAGQAAQSATALAIAPLIVVYNVFGVVALLASRHRLGFSAVGKIVRSVVVNPLILSCLAGLVFSLQSWSIPLSAERSLEMMGKFGFPAALLAVGGALASVPLRGSWIYPLLSSCIKTGVAPAAGFVAALVMGADRSETMIVMILMSCPTAVASYVLAGQLGGDRQLAASAVVASTVTSIISLGIILAVMNV